MEICKSLILLTILPIPVYLICQVFTYIFNKCVKLKLKPIHCQYIFCVFLLVINKFNFVSKNSSFKQYYEEINENILIQGWYIDYFYLCFVCVIINVRLIFLKNKNGRTDEERYFNCPFFINDIINILLIFFFSDYFVISVMFDLYCKLNMSYKYTSKLIKYLSLWSYCVILVIELYNWVNLVIKWNKCFLDGFEYTSTVSSLYITVSMIIIYCFQVILFYYTPINKIFMIILILMAFMNATITLILYMIYLEFNLIEEIVNKNE